MHIDEWHGCYPSDWRGKVVPQAFSHPAKFSSRLIERIYRHAAGEGWLAAGDRVVDPFGGVALGAFPALQMGLEWTGCELEARFVEIGRANLALWDKRYRGRLNRWGGAKLLQGDSRQLSEIVGRAGACISSPPYADRSVAPTNVQGYEAGTLKMNEGKTYSAVIGSPPYVNSIDANSGANDSQARKKRKAVAGIDNDKAVHRGGPNSVQNQPQTYGKSRGQLGAMSVGDFQAAISSPPYLQTQGGTGVTNTQGPLADPRLIARHAAGNAASAAYGQSEGQLSTLQSGETFWSAARAIVEQVYQVLAPGAHAIWVVKGYVHKGRYVDFPGQWRQLCEAAGFTALHEHRAMLVRRRGTQIDIDGQHVEDTVEYTSFFRRLAHKNGAPRIDWECVLCMQKTDP